MLLKSNLTLVTQRQITLYLFESLSTQAASLKSDNSDSIDWSHAKNFKKIPGPTKYGLLRGFMPGGRYHKKSIVDYFLKAREEYGDIYRLPGMFGKYDMIMSFSIDDFQKVFRTEGVWPKRPPLETLNYYKRNYQSELYKKSEGLTTSEGEQWAAIRTAVNPVLMQPRNAKSYVIPMQEVNQAFLQRIREVRDPVTKEVPGNFLDDINRLTFESIAVVALNKQLGLLGKNRDRADAKKLFNNLQTMFKLLFDLNFQPSIWKYVWTPTFSRYKKCLDQIYETTVGYVEEALKRLENEKRENIDESEVSVLEKLLKIDKSIAIVMAIDMLMAGVDTTSSSLTGILLEIAKNPEKQAKLREEVRQFLPTKDSKFTIESMTNLPYLRACIKEGLRMHPINPGIARCSGADLVLGGYQIPKGTPVIMTSNFLMREERFFPKPNEFIPERWIRDGTVQSAITPFSYIPFGFGPRMCVGKRVVDLELEITLARLVRNFYMEFNYSIENAFKTYLISTPAIPLKFRFTEVEN